MYKSNANVLQLGTQWNACADLFWDFEKSAARATQTLLGTNGSMHRQARTHKGVLCVAGWALLGRSCAHTVVQLLWDFDCCGQRGCSRLELALPLQCTALSGEVLWMSCADRLWLE